MRMLRLKRISLPWSVFLVILVCALFSLPNYATAQSDSPFEGKRMRILIGYTPAGGHDLEGRIIARHLPNHLPGSPSIIVQNMPGAGGLIQGGYIYNRARPDGLTMAVFGGSHLQNAVLGAGVEYDLAKMPIVWAVSGVRIGLVREFLKADSAKKLTEIDGEKIVVSGRSKTDSSCVMGSLAMTLLGIKGYKTVCAYGGTAVIRGAMERGEVSYFDASAAHLIGGGAYVEMFKKGMVVPIWQAGRLTPEGKIVRAPTVREDVPTFLEAYKAARGKDPSGPLWDAFRTLYNSVHGTLNRALVLPPATPPDRVNALRKAIESMAKDPAFVRDWEKIFGQKLAPVLVSATEAEQVKDEFMQPAPWQESLKKFLNL